MPECAAAADNGIAEHATSASMTQRTLWCRLTVINGHFTSPMQIVIHYEGCLSLISSPEGLCALSAGAV